MFPNNVLKVQFFAVLDNFVGADPCVRPSNSRFVCFAWRIRVSAPTNSRFVCFAWRTHVSAPIHVSVPLYLVDCFE